MSTPMGEGDRLRDAADGDQGTVEETGGTGLFRVGWDDGSVSIESEDDRGEGWEPVKGGNG